MELTDERMSILIVDDEPLNLRTLRSMLELDYNIKVANSGETAITMMEKYRFDLVMLDVLMPGVTGFDVLEIMKEEDALKNIPVIIITGLTDTDSEVHGLTLGAVDYITKPFVEIVVKLRVQTHLKLISQMRAIEYYGLMDALTEIPNRRNFDRQVEMVWSQSLRAKTGVGLLLIDIDKFKNFNDTYGHAFGDIVLKAVAKTLRRTAKRGSDFVARWGGEEFVVLVHESNPEGMYIIAERLREAVENLKIVCDSNTNVSVTISLGGGCLTPTPANKFDVFMKQVDDALYRAKTNGRNRVEMI